MEDVFELISDIHIDHWDNNYKAKYPCCKTKNHPLIYEDKKDKILIVAGDICDDIEISINYLDEISKYYKKILFVDGNHEHTTKYPYLNSVEYIDSLVKKKKNEKLVYLPNNDFFYEDYVIIGCCGWWNYQNENEQEKINNQNYFNKWIKHFTLEDNKIFIDNVIACANQEYKTLKNKIEKYNCLDNVKKIIIVTHTIPLVQFCDEDEISTELNTSFKNIIDNNKKIKSWVFGHTHQNFHVKKNNVHFICNPRGRPDDFNRKTYNILNLESV